MLHIIINIINSNIHLLLFNKNIHKAANRENQIPKRSNFTSFTKGKAVV